MKTKRHSCIPLHMLLLAGLIPGIAPVTATAAQAAGEHETPVIAEQQPTKPLPAVPETPPAPKPSVAFLGIATTPADDATRQRLKLPEGTGLRIQFVAPNGPAAQKLQAGDVLSQLDDQILCNHEQLRALVRAKNPGDTVNIKLYRDGQKSEAIIKLGKAPAGPEDRIGETAPPLFLPDINIQYNGKDIPVSDMLRQRMAKMKDGVLSIDPESFKDLPEDLRETLKDLRGDFEKRREEFNARRTKRAQEREKAAAEKPGTPAAQAPATDEKIKIEITPDDGTGAILDAGETPKSTHTGTSQSFSFSLGDGVTSSIIINDDKGTVAVTKHDGSRRVTIKNTAGKVVFDGPVDTKEQRDALPPEAKKRLELIDSLTGEK